MNMYQAKVQVFVAFFKGWLTWCHRHFKKCSLFTGSVVMQAEAQPSSAVTAAVRCIVRGLLGPWSESVGT